MAHSGYFDDIYEMKSARERFNLHRGEHRKSEHVRGGGGGAARHESRAFRFTQKRLVTPFRPLKMGFDGLTGTMQTENSTTFITDAEIKSYTI